MWRSHAKLPHRQTLLLPRRPLPRCTRTIARRELQQPFTAVRRRNGFVDPQGRKRQRRPPRLNSIWFWGSRDAARRFNLLATRLDRLDSGRQPRSRTVNVRGLPWQDSRVRHAQAAQRPGRAARMSVSEAAARRRRSQAPARTLLLAPESQRRNPRQPESLTPPIRAQGSAYYCRLSASPKGDNFHQRMNDSFIRIRAEGHRAVHFTLDEVTSQSVPGTEKKAKPKRTSPCRRAKGTRARVGIEPTSSRWRVMGNGFSGPLHNRSAI